MKTFKEYIKIKESAYGSTGGIEPPLQRPDIIVSSYNGPIPGNIKNSEIPIPKKRKIDYKKFRKDLFNLPKI
jgi:hypothetical protein